MATVVCDISISLDGFSAGPNDGPDNPMGDNGLEIHEWFLQRHTSPVVQDSWEFFQPVGAVVMGRRMFENGIGVWGDEAPWDAPIFVVTHRTHAPVEKMGRPAFFFVDSFEEGLAQAIAAAGERYVIIAGGACLVQQALRAGVVDKLAIHVTPVLLGGGIRLFDDAGPYQPGWTVKTIRSAANVAHIEMKRA